jgi:D-lactate dehydrogenase (cytochrome)
MAVIEAMERSRGDRQAAAKVIATLAARFGNRLVTSQAVREQHANTLTWIDNQPPDAVVFPQTTEDVQWVVRLCAAERVPVIAFGAGTSLEGQINAPRGGISLDFRDMNRLLAVHAEDLDCVVEPGITRKQLNEQLRDQGVFFPVDPGAAASLGGMAATRCSGTNAVRYGTMKDNVISLKVVLANGEVMATARRAKKSSSGYDLTRLMVGAEGTLGVITELTLRLSGIPEAISSGVCPFPTVEAACNATILTIQSGIPVARIELLDALQVRASNMYSKLALPETPVLFLEFHGTDAGVAEQSQRFGEIAQELGGGPFDWATRAEDRSRLWQARHDAYWAGRGLRPGAHAIATDVCVPISRLAACVSETQHDIAASNLLAPLLGHVGDGNFHLTLMVDLGDGAEVARAKAFLERLVERALAMDGTCTGEHGVGQGKMKYLLAEHGAPALAAMAALKRALDPLDIMNPGKIVSLERRPDPDMRHTIALKAANMQPWSRAIRSGLSRVSASEHAGPRTAD